MHAKTVKKQCTFARSRAINKLFHIERFIGWYRATCRLIFQKFAIFCCKLYGERFSHIVSAAGKKGNQRISRPTRPIF